MSYIVYKHIFPNGKVYIGITGRKPEDRWENGHGYDRHQTIMKNAIQKYGWDNIQHEILYTDLTQEEAEQKEIELIAFYKSNQREYGYNIANGGSLSGKHSEETKDKLRKINTGKHHTEEARKKMSEAKKGEKNHNYGKHFSEEHKKRISESNSGKLRSEETKKNISESKKGRNHPNYGKKRKTETVEKIIKANIKKIKCIETGIVFDGLKNASKEMKISIGGISMVCNGKKKTICGYRFEFVD